MPLSRRTALTAVLIALLIALALPVGGAPAARAQDPDTITIGTTDLPTSLDPGDAYDFAAWEVLSHLYTGLTRQVPGTVEYELALAESVTVSDDRLTYTFTLRPDAVFSDGTPITAQTFVDSITRTRALERDAAQVIEDAVETVTADDEGHLVFTLERPVPYFLALLSLPPYFPQHPDLAASEQPQPFAEGLIGNGPYTLDSFDVGDGIVLAANPSYTLGPAPLTPRIVLRGYPRAQDLREALLNGEVDLAWRALFTSDLTTLQNADGIQLIDVPSTRVFYLDYNHTREPFEDPFAREGVTLFLNRASLVNDALHGFATPLTSLVPELFADAYAPVWPDAPDVERAEEVLRAASYSTRGSSRLQFQINFSQPTYGDAYVGAVGELIRASFSPTDFVDTGAFSNIETSTFVRALERGEGQAFLFAWTPIVPDPAAYLGPLVHSRSMIPRNAGYASDDKDALLDQAALLDDPAARGALYRDVAGLLLNAYDLVPLWQDHIQVAARDGISGITLEPNFFLHYDLLARD
ncbi:MAG TPA: ABC transporter substrate-binding protein [Aggregatilinea sp.]|uniref:ABC transporter substrate-binding protein n=1 Tax=Aggregatilinea sp. TaxID=2806333 RepID=UPI002C38F759|nr:ABC transporter substrate-binding protein [Aggregatilinea sp.]HML21665.1 ABC transporter substrate-binding protein [Aggregatilinea sp.]